METYKGCKLIPGEAVRLVQEMCKAACGAEHVENALDSIPEIYWGQFRAASTAAILLTGGQVAVTEPKANCDDAVLELKVREHAKKLGIPMDDVAALGRLFPNCRDVVEKLFGIPGGYMDSYVGNHEKLAMQIATIIVERSGRTSLSGKGNILHINPTIKFIDNGIGQEPYMHFYTFLNLMQMNEESDKRKLPWLPGFYSLGSFMSMRWGAYTVILSRRALVDRRCPYWGLTIVRRSVNHETGGFQYHYLYLLDADGNRAVPCLPEDTEILVEEVFTIKHLMETRKGNEIAFAKAHMEEDRQRFQNLYGFEPDMYHEYVEPSKDAIERGIRKVSVTKWNRKIESGTIRMLVETDIIGPGQGAWLRAGVRTNKGMRLMMQRMFPNTLFPTRFADGRISDTSSLGIDTGKRGMACAFGMPKVLVDRGAERIDIEVDKVEGLTLTGPIKVSLFHKKGENFKDTNFAAQADDDRIDRPDIWAGSTVHIMRSGYLIGHAQPDWLQGILGYSGLDEGFVCLVETDRVINIHDICTGLRLFDGKKAIRLLDTVGQSIKNNPKVVRIIKDREKELRSTPTAQDEEVNRLRGLDGSDFGEESTIEYEETEVCVKGSATEKFPEPRHVWVDAPAVFRNNIRTYAALEAVPISTGRRKTVFNVHTSCEVEDILKQKSDYTLQCKSDGAVEVKRKVWWPGFGGIFGKIEVQFNDGASEGAEADIFVWAEGPDGFKSMQGIVKVVLASVPEAEPSITLYPEPRRLKIKTQSFNRDIRISCNGKDRKVSFSADAIPTYDGWNAVVYGTDGGGTLPIRIVPVENEAGKWQAVVDISSLDLEDVGREYHLIITANLSDGALADSIVMPVKIMPPRKQKKKDDRGPGTLTVNYQYEVGRGFDFRSLDEAEWKGLGVDYTVEAFPASVVQQGAGKPLVGRMNNAYPAWKAAQKEYEKALKNSKTSNEDKNKILDCRRGYPAKMRLALQRSIKDIYGNGKFQDKTEAQKMKLAIDRSRVKAEAVAESELINIDWKNHRYIMPGESQS